MSSVLTQSKIPKSLDWLRKRLTAIALILLVALPILASLWFGLTAEMGGAWDHILTNRLLPYTTMTLFVLILTGAFILLLAVPTAWLISQYEFPGRRVFEWALILPLAMPGYVMAYAWADLANVSGPMQSALRNITGWSARDYWFPDLFTPTGLAFVLASTLFPYVYITARAAFTTQSAALLEAGRTLGSNGIDLFIRAALPAARPAILAGLALALMEAAADYGAADYLGIQTLGVGIIRAWTSYGEPATAARLAVMLILIAFTFLWLSRWLQGQAGSQQTSSRWLSPTRARLSRAQSAMATIVCCTLLLIAFILPMGRLVWHLMESGAGRTDIWPSLRSSLILGLAGTALALACGLIFVLGLRTAKRLKTTARLSVISGYAMPGVVLGLGGLFLLQALDLSLTGWVALALLIWVYAARFTAAGVEPLQARVDRLPKSLDFATRSLGSFGLHRLWRVDLPLLTPGLLAAALILFVETLKELPATLMLRPTGWDTLAVRAHAYASDERLAEATLPSLLIVLAGIGPVMLLSWRLSHERKT